MSSYGGSYHSVRPSHRVIAVLVPFLFVWMVGVYTTYFAMVEFFSPPTLAYAVLLFTVAVIQVVSTDKLSKTRGDTTSWKLREFLVILILSYGVLLATDGGLFSGTPEFLAGPVLFATLLVALEWFLAYSVHKRLKQRELFLGLLKNTSGNELVAAVRDAAQEYEDLQNGLTYIRRLIIVSQLVFLILLYALFIRYGALLPLWIVLAVSNVAVMFVTFVALNRFAEEHVLLSSGVTPPKNTNTRRNGALALMLIIALSVVFPLSRDKAVIPPEEVGNFLSRLNELLNRRDLRGQSEGITDIAGDSMEDDLSRFRPEGVGEGPIKQNDFLPRLMRVLALIAGGAVGIGLLAFLVRPLFALRRIRVPSPSEYIQRLRTAFGRLIHRIGHLLRKLKEQRKTITDVARQTVRELQETRTARREKKKERDKERQRAKELRSDPVIREFIHLVRWAAKRGIPLEGGEAPAAYVDKVSRQYPAMAEQLDYVGRFFEEAVYSSHEMSHERNQQYRRHIREITKVKG